MMANVDGEWAGRMAWGGRGRTRKDGMGRAGKGEGVGDVTEWGRDECLCRI